MSEHTRFTVTADLAGQRADSAIASQLDGFSRTAVKRLIAEGHVTINGELVRPKRALAEGDVVEVAVPAPVDATPQPQDIPLDIVYEDGDIIVVNKPAGFVVHPAPGFPDGTLVNALLHHCDDLSGIGGVRRPGIVHRIDKNTTGLLAVAKNDRAHLSLKEQLATREMKRIYLALIAGSMAEESGEIDAPIGRHHRHRTLMTVRADGREARSLWTVRRRVHGLTLLDVALDTGRSHQIRVHFKYIGRPVVGDPDYGLAPKQAVESLPPQASRLRQLVRSAKRQMLHARQLRLRHPSSDETMTFDAPTPPDFQRIIDLLDEAI